MIDPQKCLEPAVPVNNERCIVLLRIVRHICHELTCHLRISEGRIHRRHKQILLPADRQRGFQAAHGTAFGKPVGDFLRMDLRITLSRPDREPDIRARRIFSRQRTKEAHRIRCAFRCEHSFVRTHAAALPAAQNSGTYFIMICHIHLPSVFPGCHPNRLNTI